MQQNVLCKATFSLVYISVVSTTLLTFVISVCVSNCPVLFTQALIG